MRMKVLEPILLLGASRFENLNIRVRVRGGGSCSQVLAIRQAIAKAIIAYSQKYDDEAVKRVRNQRARGARCCPGPTLTLPNAAASPSQAGPVQDV